jgi:dihydroxyacetone kinase-like protein
MAPAANLAQEMMDAILGETPAAKGDDVLLLVNGFGGTPLMELYLMYAEAVRLCADHGLVVARSHVGNVTTSLEMQGCSFTVTALDGETTGLWDAPVHTAALRWGC